MLFEVTFRDCKNIHIAIADEEKLKEIKKYFSDSIEKIEEIKDEKPQRTRRPY